MANYMGSTFENTPIQSSVNLPLIQQVLSVKQGQYDANRAKIDQTLQAFGNIDLIRDVDKDYLSARMNDVYNSIEAVGNRDFSQPYVADDIVGKVRNAAKDPFIMDAMANTAKFRTFQKDVEEVKKKDINKFNNANYNDALELGGFGAWSNGDTNSLGTLQYNEYTDAKGNARKLAEDYVKNFQMKEHLLGAEAGKYFDKYTYGYDVDEVAVKRYVEANLDEKSRVQLQIDARQSVGKLPESDFNSYIRTAKEADNRDANLQIANLEATKKTESSKDIRDAIDNKIQSLKTGVSENNAKIASGRFDKNEMYSVYNDQVSSGIAAGFDLKGTTKIDMDDSKFQVMKFQTDVAFKQEELGLKREALALDALKLKAAQDANVIAQGGTPIDVPQELKPEVAETEVISKGMYRADQALDSYLENTNMDGYSSKTPEQQWAYKTSLQYTNPQVGNDQTLNSLLVNFKNSQKAYSETYSPLVENTTKLYENVYNDMLGGKGTKLDNFARTAPLTANMLKANKSFDSLNDAQKRGVRMELMTNSLQYGGLEDNERDIVEKAINRDRVRLNSDKSESAKAVKNYVKSNVVDTEDSGFISAMSSLGKTTFGLAKTAMSAIIDPYEYNINALRYGEDYAKREEAKRDIQTRSSFAQAEKSAAPLQRFHQDVFGIRQDTNIAEIGADDLRSNSTIKDASVIDYLRSNLSKYNSLAIEKAKTFIPTQISNKAYAFSEDIKEQKPIAVALAQTAMAQAGAPVGFHEANNFTVQREGDAFRISAVSKKGNPVSVVVSNLPPSVAKIVDTGNLNWQTSAMNPNVAVQTDIIKPISTVVEREQAVKNITNTASGTMPQGAIDLLNLQPSKTFMATPDEIRNTYEDMYGKNTVQQHEQVINQILQLNPAFTPFSYGGQFWTKAKYVDPTSGKVTEEISQQPLGEQYNPSEFYLRHMDMARLIKDRLAEKTMKPRQ